jgi:succinate dehydrogenase flavin-adding protein (antitoxin of CptAB toxin-antitoxin module)
MNINKNRLIKKFKIDARRGNLETDLLLNQFIDSHLVLETNPVIWSDFKQLLALDEQTLLNALLQPEQAELRFLPLLKLIRKNYLISTD